MGMAARTHQDRSGPSPSGDPVARAAAGDDSAWAELVRLYARRVYALARSRLRDHHAAEEVTQSVFMTVSSKLREGGYTEMGRFEPWLFRIAANRVRDEVRRRRAAPTMTSGESVLATFVDGTPSVREAEPPSFGALREAMGKLGDADREVIELRHHGQMSFKQIAAMTGEPMGTLLARHHRALAKLRTMMEETTAEAATPDDEGAGEERSDG